ncbi:DUF485 domain-containing protein [Streptomyces winkii]|uniref:DUF485 domain-containing protein n=1 Tax=Streptomyces winkii TaxID=3051178 RepID=UPI0028D4B66A|nr:DUF485 domain-containing protein [Streptomyces sp. DSM 40971]
MRPAYRTGSSSEALTAARRIQLQRGLGLVLGVFLLYALASCFVPAVLPVEVFGGFRVGELAAAAQVLVIAVGVLRHDRHARRHVEPLAQRVATREPGLYADVTGRPRTSGTAASAGSAASAAPTVTAMSAASAAASGDIADFNAFDSSRAFGDRGAHRAARATT